MTFKLYKTNGTDRRAPNCASVLQTHATHPSLIYFRSVGTGAAWPAALDALMDLALIYEMLIDDAGSRAPAVLALPSATSRPFWEAAGRSLSTSISSK
jgi:hypothetical protein